MAESYQIDSTSPKSARIDLRVLRQLETRRLVFKPEIVKNPHDPHAAVKGCLIYQRKSKSGSWEDTPAEGFNTVRSDEQVKMCLHTEETLRLYKELQNLYKISSEAGVNVGHANLIVGYESDFIKTDSNRAGVVRALLDAGYSEEVWESLGKNKPDLAVQLSYAKIIESNKRALQEFADNLDTDQPESWWQDFFERNIWIFGYGLDYRVLRRQQSKPTYGGTDLSGRGAQLGDYLLYSGGKVKFTVLVDIKRQDTKLLGSNKYRNGAWEIGKDLMGGIVQLQSDCRTWEIDGSRTDQNRDILERESIFTTLPKGILVIGNLAEVRDDRDKLNTFERLRRNTINPEIITFDELYDRASFIVDHTSKTAILAAKEES